MCEQSVIKSTGNIFRKKWLKTIQYNSQRLLVSEALQLRHFGYVFNQYWYYSDGNTQHDPERLKNVFKKYSQSEMADTATV